jgi:two-component system, OmpR family, response regulator
VIVADDDPAMRMLCRVNLELDGYRVVEAASASEVTAALADADVAGILLDVRLGDDDGIALARQVRGDRPEVGIAFLTGSAQGPADAAAQELSAQLLGKPFSLEALSETVARLAPK